MDAKSPEELLLEAIFGPRGHKPTMRVIVKDRVRGLCGSCRNGSFVRNSRDATTFDCERFRHIPPGEIEHCTAYSDKAQMTEYQMKEIGWILTTDPVSKQIGFVRPGTKEHKDEVRKTSFPDE